MSDIFISYARSSEPQAKQVEETLRDAGYGVWRDTELPAHRTYADVIEERLKAAKAVVVLWSAEAARSQWVRAEADAGRERGTLVQASVDGTAAPIPFNQIQCADLQHWTGDRSHSGWRKLEGSIAALAGEPGKSIQSEQSANVRRQGKSICVLPFANMSGDAEQEYFSDGISEDITTDLSKVSALEVIARNTAFLFKGKAVDVTEVARKLSVSHVLEGSVRKAGNCVRITAQLIDGATGGHIWADRYDRDLTDIFTIQDEISKAIVAALKLKLLPEEKKAIEQRGTTNADAYNLYLMARQQWISGTAGQPQREEAIVRLCKQATLLDPDYAEAWALMAIAQAELRFWHGTQENALPAAERALEVQPDLSEARCVKARYLEDEGRHEEAERQLRTALKQSPESWEVNREAARMLFRQDHIADAVPFFEKSTLLMETDWHSPMMLVTCYQSLGDEAKARDAARTALERSERAVAQDPANSTALASGAFSLAMFGETERAREWLNRAMLLDPDNLNMRYNVACTLVNALGEKEEALDVLEPYFERVSSTAMRHVAVDPDLDPIREVARFKKMLAAAKERLGTSAAAE